MLNKENKIILEGVIQKIVGGGTYIVKLDGGLNVYTKLKGKLRNKKIKMLPGDRVEVLLNEIDPTKGYILFRL